VEGLITAAARQDRLSPTDELDVTRIAPDGTHGYTIATFRAGIEIVTNVKGRVVVENFANKAYRVHGSGIDGSGTNFVIGVDVTF
jgi:hemoglobin/transferrin/lactoferrin receptor protein